MQPNPLRYPKKDPSPDHVDIENLQLVHTPTDTNPGSKTTSKKASSSDTPIPRPSLPAHTVRVRQPQPVRMKKHVRLWMITLLVIPVVFGGLAAFSATRSHVSEPDLVSSTVDHTTLLRPKQWSHLTGSSEGYGNTLGPNGQSTASIVVTESDASRKGVVTGEPARQSQIRDIAFNAISDSIVNAALTGEDRCQEISGIKKQKDQRADATTVRLYTVTGNCKNDDGDFIVHIKAFVGKDDRIRTVAFRSTQQDWERNKAVFQKMIDSAKQK